MSFFEAATLVDPLLADAWRELGRTEWRLGRLREDKVVQAKASAALRKAIDLAPDQYDTYAMLAYMQSINGDLPGALSICEPLVKAGKAAGFLCKGSALEGAGKTDQVIECYRLGVQTHPTDESLLNAFVAALEHSGRYNEAVP